MTIDTAAATLNVAVANGTLQYEDTTARTLTIGASVIVDTGATFQSAATGAQTGHVLSVGASLITAGTVNFSTCGNTGARESRSRVQRTPTLMNTGTLT